MRKLINLFGEEVVFKKTHSTPKKIDEGRSLERIPPASSGETTIQRMMRLSRITMTIDYKKDEEEIAQVISKFKIQDCDVKKAEEVLKDKPNLSVIQALSLVIYGDCLELQFKIGEEELNEHIGCAERETSERAERTHFPSRRRTPDS